MNARFLASFESRWRPLLTRFPAALVVRLYSRGRQNFLRAFDGPAASAYTPIGLERTLWGLRFRAPLMNAAGMFKNGESYSRVTGQGAGAYLAGTTTHRPRTGNRRRGVSLPFAPYPRSGAASNWLGLPNRGHRNVAARLAKFERHEGVPIGVSLGADPEPSLTVEEKLQGLVEGLELYQEAGVDFLEINESCPNTAEGPSGLSEIRARLGQVDEAFLARRSRILPVVVKFSCDTEPEQVPHLLDLLLELGFDGVNFGNTSTAYARHRPHLAAVERPLFDHFWKAYGGGLSGRPLKADSLELCRRAVEHRDRVGPGREFHVIRTGGVEGGEDLRRSLDVGVALCQWYTGYFEAFGRWGDRLYREVFEGCAPLPSD